MYEHILITHTQMHGYAHKYMSINSYSNIKFSKSSLNQHKPAYKPQNIKPKTWFQIKKSQSQCHETCLLVLTETTSTRHRRSKEVAENIAKKIHSAASYLPGPQMAPFTGLCVSVRWHARQRVLIVALPSTGSWTFTQHESYNATLVISC